MPSYVDRISDVVAEMRTNMNPQQCHFLYEAQNIAESYMDIFTDGVDDDDPDLKEVEEDLKAILRAMKRCIKQRKRFKEMYPTWLPQRCDNIQFLNSVADSMSTHRKNCNISKLVGSVVSFLGGSLCVASAALLPVTLGASASLGIAGVALTSAGGGTAFGSSMADIGLHKSLLNKASACLEKDIEIYERDMRQFVESSKELAEAIDRIVNFNFLVKVKGAFQEFASEGFRLYGNLKKKLGSFVWEIVDKIISSPVFMALKLPGGTLPYALAKVIPLIVCFLIAGFFMSSENRIAFDCVVATIHLIRGVFIAVDLSFDISSAILSSILKGTGQATSKAVAQAAVRGAVAGLGVIIDTASIALTSKDIHEGSVSEVATAIRNTAQKLEEQVKVLSSVYDNMK